jgi:hypothetical protein
MCKEIASLRPKNVVGRLVSENRFQASTAIDQRYVVTSLSFSSTNSQTKRQAEDRSE